MREGSTTEFWRKGEGSRPCPKLAGPQLRAAKFCLWMSVPATYADDDHADGKIEGSEGSAARGSSCCAAPHRSSLRGICFLPLIMLQTVKLQAPFPECF